MVTSIARLSYRSSVSNSGQRTLFFAVKKTRVFGFFLAIIELFFTFPCLAVVNDLRAVDLGQILKFLSKGGVSN